MIRFGEGEGQQRNEAILPWSAAQDLDGDIRRGGEGARYRRVVLCQHSLKG